MEFKATLRQIGVIAGLVLAGLGLLLFLDLWLIGGVVALPVMYMEGEAAAWRATWLPPWGALQQILSPATATAHQVRELWLAAQLPLVYGVATLGWQLYKTHVGAGYETDKQTHGSARFMRPAEIRNLLAPGLGPGLIFGRLSSTWFRYPFEYPPTRRGQLNQFVIVYGGSGKGKTRGYIVPNLLNEDTASIICTDPKGEVCAKTASTLHARGYEIWVVNLNQKAHSLGYNPLAYCHTAADVFRLINTIMGNTSNPENKGGDPFWEQAEAAYLEALTLYLVNERPPEERHLPSLLRLATRLPRDPEAMDALFDALSEDHPARSSYDIFRLAEDKTRAGVLIGAAVRLRLWAEPELAAMMSCNQFDLRELGRRRIALYLIIPDDEATYAPVTSLLFGQAIQELYDEASQHPGQRLPVPVRLRLDEAANIGRIPEFAKKVATMRGRGLSPEIILQNHTQGRDVYGDTWESIEGNCDWLVYLGGNSQATAKAMSERLGIQTVKTEQASQKGVTESTTRRDVLTPDEVLRIKPDELVVLPAGHLPIRMRKIDYEDLAEWRGLAELSPHTYPVPHRGSPVITDVERLMSTVMGLGRQKRRP